MSNDDAPEVDGMLDLTYGMSPEEFEEADQGRSLCIDCGEFFAPDGTDEHPGCPLPRDPYTYPPGLLN